MLDISNHVNDDLVRQHIEALHRQAAKHAIAEEARRGQQRSARSSRPFLARMGRWLLAWGLRLQIRYGMIAERSKQSCRTITASTKSHQITTKTVALPEAPCTGRTFLSDRLE